MKFENLIFSVQEKYQLDSRFVSSTCDLEEWDTIRKLCTVLFPSTTMIGEYVLSDEQCAEIELLGKKHFQKLLFSDCSRIALSALEAKELFYSAVFFTQKMDDNKNSSENDTADDQLWNTLYSQFGYDELNDPPSKQKVYSVMREIIKGVSRYSSDHGHKYYNTLKAQALVPKSAYIELINIANNFYERNLECQYDEAENAFQILAENIGKKVGKDLSEIDIKVGAKVWSLSSSIKELLIYEPVYMAAVFDAITAKIDMLRRGDTPKFSENNRWDCLIKSWFEQKSQEEKDAMHNIRAKRIGQKIATRSEAIHARYSLIDDDFRLTIPGIRLPEITQQPTYRLLQNGRIVESGKLSIYGDEMCYTTREHTCYLSENVQIEWSASLNFQVEIACGENLIYCSKDELYREYIVFNRSGIESNIKKCEDGDIILVASKSTAIHIIDPEEQFYEESLASQYQRFRISLQSAQQILVNNNNILEGEEKKELHCYCTPSPIDGVQLQYGGEQCAAFREPPVLHIALASKEDAIRYQLFIDSEMHQLQEYFQNDRISEIALPSSARFCRTIKLKEFSTGKLVYSFKYMILPKFDYRFSQPYYLNRGESGALTVHMGGNTQTVKFDLLENQKNIEIPLWNPMLMATISVPIVDVLSDGENVFFWPKQLWCGAISQSTFIRVSAPKSIKLTLLLGTKSVTTSKSKNVYELGNMLSAYQKVGGPQPLWLAIQSDDERKQILLSDLYFNPGFIESPLVHEGSVLTWDPENKYVGPDAPTFRVEVENDSSQEPWTYRAEMKRDVLEKNYNCRPGVYGCSVYLRSPASNSPFAMMTPDELIWVSELTIEEDPESRFQNSNLYLTSVRFFFQKTNKQETAQIRRNEAVIEEIKYDGFDNYDGSEYHFYTGTLIFQMPDGRWCSMNATENNAGFEHINPIRFCVMEDNHMQIFNADGDTLFLNATHYEKNGHVRILNRNDLSLSKDEQLNLLPFADLFDYREEKLS